MSDGARNALGGYLYQIVGGAGLAARAMDVSGLERGELCYALIIEAKNARVLHEVNGEDLLLCREDAICNSGTAVQFKFSRNAVDDAVTPSELRDMLRAFRCHAAAASVEFPVTAYVLVTNRDLNEKIKGHYRRRTTSFDDLKKTERGWLDVPNSKKNEIEKEFGTVEAAARAWYAVFQNLSVFPRVAAEYWLRALREYAKARGLYDNEFDPALSRLVGDAISTTLTGTAEFSRDWLNSCLIGFSDARSLQLSAPADDSARQAAAKAVRDWLSERLGTTEQELVRRNYLTDLENQLAQHPIVLVLGGGGCGKSTLAAQFLLNSAPSRFVAVVSARDLRAPWLGQEFNAWRGPLSSDSRPSHLSDDVPRRLRHANPCGSRPILLVDIDGIDEQGDRGREDIRALVTVCRDLRDGGITDMALILTSRIAASAADRARRNLIADLFSTDCPGEFEDLFGLVRVDDFTEMEFAELLRRADTVVRRRLQMATGMMSGALPDTTMAESEMPPNSVSVTPEILASLRHPVLWGVFSKLSTEDQHRVLDGASAGLYRLAQLFVERFCQKANRRRPTLQPDRIWRALVRIAKSFPANHALARRQANWVTHAANLVTQDEAAFLFDEAISYGMIREEEPGQWTWRHRFLRLSLSAQEA